MKQILLFSFFLFVQSVFSQTLLKGKVISDAANLEGIQVLNISNKQTVVTSQDGSFSILAMPTDMLVFSGMLVKSNQVILKASNFSEPFFIMKLEAKINQLEEIVIKNYPHINAISLGIVSKDIKTYTPAERKLISSSGGLGIVQLINAINGKTDELKKGVEIEKKEILVDKISKLFEENFFVETLKIPAEYIKGFQIFSIDDSKVVESLKVKNKTLTAFYLNDLAINYLKLIDEKK